MKCLDLFSGTHSVAKVLKEQGHDVITLDLQGSDININILEWDYKAYPNDYFDYIHASPPCQYFSICRKSNYGRCLKLHNQDKTKEPVVFTKALFHHDQKELGLPLLEITLDIIAYFNPTYYTIENPSTGDMKHYMEGIPYTDVTYCKYGFPYKKPTRVWNNFNFDGYFCQGDCKFLYNKVHIQQCGNTKCARKVRHIQTIEGIKGGSNTKNERYRIPPKLIEHWIESF